MRFWRPWRIAEFSVRRRVATTLVPDHLIWQPGVDCPM